MNLYIIVEKEEKVEIFNKSGKLLRSFSIKENLPQALDLLQQFNKLTDQKGNFLYNLFLYKEISLWAFHQEFIFWQYFRDFSKYEEVYKFVCEQGSGITLQTKDASSELRRILRAVPHAKIIPCSFFKTIINSVVSFVLKVLAWLVTYWALIKLKSKKEIKVIYSPDKYSKFGCDFRIYPLYKYLQENKKDYLEIFHTGWGKEFLSNLLKRKRVAIYLESLVWYPNQNNFKIDEADFSSFPNHLSNFFKFLLKEMLARMSYSQQLILKLEKILSKTAITEIMALDDMRYTNELVVACKKNNIKIYGLQHGQFTKYHVGWMNYGLPKERGVAFDKLFVWNEYWRNLLLKYSTQYDEKNVVVGGWLRRLPEIVWEEKKTTSEEKKIISILLPFEISLSPEEISGYVRKFLLLGVKIFFKVRPDLTREKQLKHYGFLSTDNVEVVETVDGQILSQIDAVVGVYSTFLSEMIYYEKPLIQLDCSFDLGHYLKDDNLAGQLPKDFNLEILNNLIKNYHSQKNVVWPQTKDINTLFAEILN